MGWISQSNQGAVAARRIVSTDPQMIREMTSLLGVASLKDTVHFYQQNQHESNEEFWQRELSKRSYLFNQVFFYPIVVIEQKAYVGGKQIDNRSGYIADFLAKATTTDSLVFIDPTSRKAIQKKHLPGLSGVVRSDCASLEVSTDVHAGVPSPKGRQRYIDSRCQMLGDCWQHRRTQGSREEGMFRTSATTYS
jgi:hypothetical protein